MDELPALRGERLAGALLYRAGPLAAGVVLSVAVAALVLVPLQLWRPWVALPVVAVGVAAAWRGAGLVPAPAAPVWAVGLSVAVAAGHGVWALLTHAEHVVLRRDAGSYALYSQWIATRHGLPVEASVEAFGGSAALADPAISFASPAFFEVVRGGGTSVDVVPQFMVGAPAWFSLGYWAGGFDALFALPAVASALAVLAVAGLAARLVGPRWAPLAAAALALTQPVLHAARSTYSEPLALLLVAAAASLLVDATSASGPARSATVRPLALAAGLAVGLAGLVRVDALREVALLLPVAAALAMVNHPAARPLVVGALAGTAASTLAAVGLSWPYVVSIAASLAPLAAGTAVLALACLAAVAWQRRRAPRRWTAAPWARLLPSAAAGAVVVVAAVLATRPWWQVVRQDPADPGARVVAGLQLRQGLTVDGGRTYAEDAVAWVSWWTGPVVLVLAAATFAVLAARAVRWWAGPADQLAQSVPPWLGPAFVALGSVVLTLYRPGITPDHPWADRRLVPVVLPAVVIAATAAVAWLVLRARRHLPATLYALVGVSGVLVMLVPAAVATWPVAGAGARTELGEVAGARAVCAALGPRDVVLAVDGRGANEWPQVVRGVCDRPAAAFTLRDEAALVQDVPRVAARVVEAGYRPVLLAAEDPAVLTALGLEPALAADLATHEDQRLLTRRPHGTAALDVRVWLAPWPAPAGG